MLTLAVALNGVKVSAQSAVALPLQVQQAHTIFIDNETASDAVSNSALLALTSSDLNPVSERSKADLVFRFKRKVPTADRSVNGERISIAIRNTYTLEVIDTAGDIVWQGSADLDPGNVRKDSTAASLNEWLKRHPAGQLVNRFLIADGQKK